jgi:hypothetical protein
MAWVLGGVVVALGVLVVFRIVRSWGAARRRFPGDPEP